VVLLWLQLAAVAKRSLAMQAAILKHPVLKDVFFEMKGEMPIIRSMPDGALAMETLTDPALQWPAGMMPQACALATGE
jgi:hypothetical protein